MTQEEKIEHLITALKASARAYLALQDALRKVIAEGLVTASAVAIISPAMVVAEREFAEVMDQLKSVEEIPTD